MIMKINQNQKHWGGGGPLNNYNSGTGTCKIITFIIDVMGEKQTTLHMQTQKLQ